ncbi:hypothetical protein ACWDY7_13180 [Streptomyces calvus]|uniref:Regulatory protein n=1 Tax=Streptomyces calvus TaxID=67282 RepID=A0AA40SDC1_9ACTN|nr:hypothetical protein [Streptomyces calvus]MBA8944198.1 hypothetical protein [Streptomyces calvus]GGP53920.1 hypothetical protein GCM10010247_28020 [Streptomyces calvus]
MSENSTAATDLTSQYTAQVAGDLERNVKEQERITAEIAALREQLTVLQHDHAILVSMQQALGLTAAPAEPAAPSEPAAASRPAAAQESEAAEPAATTGSEAPAGGATVPAPRRRRGAKSGADKPKRGRTTGPRTASGKSAAKPSAVKSPTAKAPSAKSAGTKASAVKTKKQTKQQTQAEAEAPTSRVVKADGPTSRAAKAAKPAKAEGPKLVELVRGHLAEHREPRSAAEVATALGQAHPDRTIRTTVVRSTLEGLVARNQAQRTKQGTSVFYTAPDAAPRTADGEAGAAS